MNNELEHRRALHPTAGKVRRGAIQKEPLVHALVLALVLVVVALGTPSARGATTNAPTISPTISARSYILIDATTNRVLSHRDADLPLPPASLTKIMTSYIAAEELARGHVRLDDAVPVSVKAWRTGGSKMFIREGTTVRLEDLLRGIVVQSGNDASVAVAEYIAGDEAAFADLMNQHAATLGLADSHFVNATGLPAEGHVSSARDLAALSRALIQNHPGHYRMYAERSFAYADIEQQNRNRLLWRDPAVDGIKTGHTDAAGFCLVTSAVRGDMRLIVAVMGTDSDEARFRETQKLLNYGFRYFETTTLRDAGDVFETRSVIYGDADAVDVVLTKALAVTMPKGRKGDLVFELDVPEPLEAPLSTSRPIGALRVLLDDEALAQVDVMVGADVAQAGFFSRLMDDITAFFDDFMR